MNLPPPCPLLFGPRISAWRAPARSRSCRDPGTLASAPRVPPIAPTASRAVGQDLMAPWARRPISKTPQSLGHFHPPRRFCGKPHHHHPPARAQGEEKEEKGGRRRTGACRCRSGPPEARTTPITHDNIVALSSPHPHTVASTLHSCLPGSQEEEELEPSR